MSQSLPLCGWVLNGEDSNSRKVSYVNMQKDQKKQKRVIGNVLGKKTSVAAITHSWKQIARNE